MGADEMVTDGIAVGKAATGKSVADKAAAYEIVADESVADEAAADVGKRAAGSATTSRAVTPHRWCTQPAQPSDDARPSLVVRKWFLIGRSWRVRDSPQSPASHGLATSDVSY